jgi:hypothetical protein
VPSQATTRWGRGLDGRLTNDDYACVLQPLRPPSQNTPCVASDVLLARKHVALELWSVPFRLHGVRFSPELREGVASGDITLSIRRWQRPKVRVGRRYESKGFQIEIDSVEVLPFSAVTADDVSRSGESDRELLRKRAAHAGPVDEHTLVYRIEFHVV